MRISAPQSRADRTLPRALVALNLVLLAVLALITLVPKAGAQLGSSVDQRARGEYILVGGEPASGNSNAIYILDTANRELVAVRWNESTKVLEGIGYRDLSVDIFAEPDR